MEGDPDVGKEKGRVMGELCVTVAEAIQCILAPSLEGTPSPPLDWLILKRCCLSVCFVFI